MSEELVGSLLPAVAPEFEVMESGKENICRCATEDADLGVRALVAALFAAALVGETKFSSAVVVGEVIGMEEMEMALSCVGAAAVAVGAAAAEVDLTGASAFGGAERGEAATEPLRRAVEAELPSANCRKHTLSAVNCKSNPHV